MFFPTCSGTCSLITHTTAQNKRNRTKSSAIDRVKTSRWDRENSRFRCAEKGHNWRAPSWKHNFSEAWASYTVVILEKSFLTGYLVHTAISCKSWRLILAASFWRLSGSMTSDVAQSFLMSRTLYSQFFQFSFCDIYFCKTIKFFPLEKNITTVRITISSREPLIWKNIHSLVKF